MKKISIELLDSIFVDEKGNFKKEEALKRGGHIAGVCYDSEGFNHIVQEPEEKTNKRIDRTLNSGHHSVHEHVNISINIHNIPKILAMVLNNEKEYVTSEKSARYTPVVVDKSIESGSSIITIEEEQLYNKWIEIYKRLIKTEYGHVFNDSKIQKLAQENARYLVTVFMPTEMVYTVSFRQINYIASFMNKYIMEANLSDPFEAKLASYMKDFVEELDAKNLLDERLMQNEKHRTLSLFDKNIDQKEIHFGDVYSTRYRGSFAQLAQAQRHRTLHYSMDRLGGTSKDYYIPTILIKDSALVDEWLMDMMKVKQVVPQGEMIKISERGIYEDFILKTKERLCTNAQLEIMQQTKATLLQYKKALEESGSPLYDDIEKHSHGARCTFFDYECLAPCKFNEGITLKRHI